MGGWSYPSYWCRICICDDALDAIESTGVELVTLGREILLDYNFITKFKKERR